MKNYLLIGAGFSHNWGGWLASEAFEFLLGDSVVVNNKTIRDLLWKHQPDGGFEAALDELQRASNATVDEAGLRSAIRRMFDAMNVAFKSSANLEFGEWIGNTRPVRDLLVRFDAIFSVNQDLLLEYLYRGTAEGLVDRSDPRTQRSWQLPGMHVSVPSEAEPLVYPPETGLMVPSNDQLISPDLQPIFKLHGSSNWRTAEGSEVMILGGGKTETIARFPMLRWYADFFRDCISRPDARLMVIGYGFRDKHINTILESGMDHGLKLFIVDPKGAYAGDSLNHVPQGASGYSPTTTQQKLMGALIGASRRSLSSIMSRDYVERQKLDRFFQARQPTLSMCGDATQIR